MPPILPEKPLAGRPVSADWAGRVVDYLHSLQPSGDGKRIMVDHMPGGTSIRWQPPIDELEDYYGRWKSENEFGTTGEKFVIRVGRVFGYYGSVDIAETEFTITAATDIWVEVTMPHDTAAFTAAIASGVYSGLRSGGPPQDKISVLLGQLLEPTTGNFQWTQKWTGSIFIPTLFWPGEHAGNIALDQNDTYLTNLTYDLSANDLTVKKTTIRHLKGLLTDEIVSTSTIIIALEDDEKVKASETDPTAGFLDAKIAAAFFEIVSEKLSMKADSITGTEIAPAVAGAALAQDGSGNLDVQVSSVTLNVVSNVSYNASTFLFEQTKVPIKIEIISDQLRITAGTPVTTTVFTAVDCPTTTTTTTTT